MALFIVWIIVSAIPSYAAIELTEQEQRWLDAHKVIVYGADADFPPFDFVDENGQVTGICRAYLNQIEKNTGIRFAYKADKWSSILSTLDEGGVDFVSASVTEERKKTKLFTRQYIIIPSAVITRKDNLSIQREDDIDGMRISTVEGWAWNQDLKNDHPKAVLVQYPSLLAAFNAVAFGEVDATVQDLATAGYVIEQNKITTLKMAASYDLPLDLQFMMRKDQPELRSILDKASAAISQEQIDAIYAQWIRLRPQPFYENPAVIRTGLITVLLILIILAWSITLKMEVNKRTRALKNTNEELERTIDDLHMLQRQLIDQEKMAALGSLVAGISHEVNSPLGVIKTVVSFLGERTKTVGEHLRDKSLSGGELQSYLEEASDSIDVMDQSVGKAIDLMQNLKTVAADQMMENREVFDVCAYLSKIRGNLKYECRKRQVEIRVECTDPLRIFSYPGAFSQVITNLVMNSLIHGFGEMTGGIISISEEFLDDTLLIRYRDNGCGMDTETMARMYEPFFTTNKGKGGTGLGMHIIRTLVVDKLAGEIECLSNPGNGVEFTIRLPKHSWDPSGELSGPQ